MCEACFNKLLSSIKTDQINANQQIELLVKKITQAESENEVGVSLKLGNLKANNL